jgi:hypothetical protein
MAIVPVEILFYSSYQLLLLYLTSRVADGPCKDGQFVASVSVRLDRRSLHMFCVLLGDQSSGE